MGKTLLVTGGSRGIGAAVCRLAARDGWDVAVNYGADEAAAADVVAAVEAAGRRAVALQADVRDAAAVAALFEQTEAALGPLDATQRDRALARAMVDLTTWEALRDQGLGPAESVAAIADMLARRLTAPPE
jgi:NAD(P)-dependent dehydrogenase (short-subunit alcohol dehydrogenase family)